MHIALIGNQAFAMLNFRGSLIRALVARGLKVSAFAPDYDDASRKAIRMLGAEPIDHQFIRTGLNPLRELVSFVRLAKHLKAIKPDLILAFTIKPVVYGTAAAWIVGVPRRFAMIEGLGHVFMETSTAKGRALKFVGSTLYKLAIAKATRSFFLNVDDKADFVNGGLVSAEKADVIGAIGVDLSHWQAAPPVSNPLTFVFVGRLLREKGIVEFAEAARLVKSRHPEVRFLVLGDVDSNPSGISRSQVENWVAEGLVTWPGQVNVASWLAQSSVFVLPSYREGVPRSTQEAMAMARPVITTDVPGCRQTVEEGANGFLIPAKNAAALAQAMLKFVMQPALIDVLGRKSRELAVERFDEKKSTSRLLAAMGL